MSNLPIRRNEVHPLNEYRPPAAPNAYRIVRWKPMYDMVVAGHILGKSNKALAEDYDKTTVTIANILRSDQAQILIKQAHDTIRATVLEDVNNVVDIHNSIKEKALKRVEKFLDNDVLATNSPFAYMNTISKYTGISSTPTVPTVVVNNNNQVNNVSAESFQRLTRALEISEGIEVDG